MALRLGIVTYNIAKDWDLDTILTKLPRLGYSCVELRTTHRHGVEVTLNTAQRATVKAKFADSPLTLCSLGSAFEYQSSDPAVVQRNIDGTREYIRLAHDLGVPGIKVRPNGVPRGEDPERVFERIGKALRIVGQDGQDFGVEIRVEVHGGVTQDPPNMAKILAAADHPNVFVCWNSNPGEVKNGSIRASFDLLADNIRIVHLRDLCDDTYPWRELFALLVQRGLEVETLAEIGDNPDPDRILRYFRALWLAYQPDSDSAQP
jgi:sugar phosphate isomerase/epimerase